VYRDDRYRCGDDHCLLPGVSHELVVLAFGLGFALGHLVHYDDDDDDHFHDVLLEMLVLVRFAFSHELVALAFGLALGHLVHYDDDDDDHFRDVLLDPHSLLVRLVFLGVVVVGQHSGVQLAIALFRHRSIGDLDRFRDGDRFRDDVGHQQLAMM